MRRFGQRGEGRIGCIFWVLVMAVGVLLALRVVPVKIATSQLKDHMEELAQLKPRGDQNFFASEIYNRARELDLPIDKKRIKVDKGPNRVIMDVELTVPLDFFVYTYNWEIKIHLDRDIFLI